MMDSDLRSRAGRVRLPGHGDGDSARADGVRAGSDGVRARADGVRRVRRMSNWTAAALLAGTSVTAVALAHHTQAVSSSSATGSGTVSASGAHGVTGPQLTGPVATSGGSGVVVTTTRRVVNGHVVITQVRHAAGGRDR